MLNFSSFCTVLKLFEKSIYVVPPNALNHIKTMFSSILRLIFEIFQQTTIPQTLTTVKIELGHEQKAFVSF